MADKASNERVYNVPLRREYLKAPLYRRAKKAVTALREFVQKHMKSESISLSKDVNENIWKSGMRNPPHHIKIVAKKEKDGKVSVDLADKPKKKAKTLKETKRQEKLKKLDEKKKQEAKEAEEELKEVQEAEKKVSEEAKAEAKEEKKEEAHDTKAKVEEKPKADEKKTESEPSNENKQ